MHDLLALEIELQVPAEAGDTLRQRLHHVPLDHRGGGVPEREADAANTGTVERLELGIRDIGMKNGDAARARSELGQRVDRHSVVGAVIARRDHHDPCRSIALLQQPIVRHGGIGRDPPRPLRRLRKAGVIDVNVAVRCVRRRLDLCRLGAGRVGHARLGTALARRQRA